MLFSKKKNKQLESILEDMKVNLQNNYKDLALDAFKKYLITLEKLKEENKLSGDEYEKYKSIGEEYKIKLKDYHH